METLITISTFGLRILQFIDLLRFSGELHIDFSTQCVIMTQQDDLPRP